jgi:hypothetical protein
VALALLAVLLVAVSLPRCGWVQKAKLDREVDRLCAIDGGVHIYEVVRLPKENFGPDGEVFPQYRQSSTAPYGRDYRSILRTELLVTGDPSLSRTLWQIVRAADSKILGEVVHYSRAGGDFPALLSNPSGHTCPGSSAGLNIETLVFKRLEE